MSRIPIVSGREVVKALSKIGYQVARQRGSHIRLRHSDEAKFKALTVPNHKTIKPFLLLKIIKQAGLDVQGFRDLL